MARKIFQKPEFTLLVSTGSRFHYPTDQILIRWEVKGAIFVKTNLSRRKYSKAKTIILPAALKHKRIIITAFGLFGTTTKTIVLRNSIIETAPIISGVEGVQLSGKQLSFAPSSVPSEFVVEVRFLIITFCVPRF